jgi:hypothetical protein
MKNFKILLLTILSLVFFNCSSTKTQSTKDGSSMENAIRVNSVSEEYSIVRSKCIGCSLKSQSLRFDNKDKPFDILTYYFDISKFYGNF